MAANIIYSGQTNIIKMVRGDSFAFNVDIYDVDAPTGLYFLGDGDYLYVGLMTPHQKFEDALLKKRYTKADQEESGHIVVRFTPEDTIDLEPGVYYYSVKLKQTDGTVITIINKAKFIIND